MFLSRPQTRSGVPPPRTGAKSASAQGNECKTRWRGFPARLWAFRRLQQGASIVFRLREEFPHKQAMGISHSSRLLNWEHALM